MEMTYGGALVMPSSYAMMDEEEMMYLEGGADYWINRVDVASGLIEGVLVLIPPLAAVSKGNRLGKGLKLAMLHAKVTKSYLIHALTQSAKKISSRITRNMVSTAVDFMWAVTGLSLGTIVATGLDYVDGCPNGLIFG